MGAVATVILAAPLLPTEQRSPGFRWNFGMGRVSAATTIDQLLLKPCTDFLPCPLHDGGKGDSWCVFWDIFLWQHPRVPWVCPRCDTHLASPSSTCRWGGWWWLLLPHPQISPCSQEHSHRLHFPLPQVLCSQQLEDLLVLGADQKFCNCLCWGNWGDWHEVSTQPLNVFAFPRLLGQCTEITVLSSLTYYWEMFNA